MVDSNAMDYQRARRGLPSRPLYGSVRTRIGAVLIDVVIITVLTLVVAQAIHILVAATVVSGGYWVLSVVMTALQGGEPGKLILGLRITEADGVTTPPRWGPSFTRTLPRLAGSVPGIGTLLALGLGVANVVLVRHDSERRSVHDRVGKTRVVHRRRS